MAKNRLVSNKVQRKADKSYAVFKNPAETLIGKIVVGLILFGTIAVILIAAVIAVIEFFS